MDYRKVWENENGPIPKDEKGRTFEIHHKDGNRSNNSIENLQCVSIEEHYKIHLDQGDYSAAAAIAARLDLSVEEIRELNSKAGQEAFKKKSGIHSLSDQERIHNGRKGGIAVRGMRWYNNGTVNKKFRETPISEEWKYGRLPCNSGVRKGTILGSFWNDGNKNVRSVNRPDGQNWVKGKMLTDDQRKRRQEIARRPRTEEHKQKISKKLKGIPRNPLSELHKNKISNAKKGIPWTEARRRALRG